MSNGFLSLLCEHHTLRAVFGSASPSQWIAEVISASSQTGRNVKASLNSTPDRSNIVKLMLIRRDSRSRRSSTSSIF